MPGYGPDRFDALEICRSENLIFFSPGLYDFPEHRVRHRRAHEGDVEHPWKTDVRDVLAFTPQEAPVFLARKTSPDAFAGHAGTTLLQAASARGGRIDASAS